MIDALRAMPRRERNERLAALPVDIRVALIYRMEDEPTMTTMPDAGMERGRIVNDRCAFPGCPRPRRMKRWNGKRTGAGRLCSAHARQWGRKGTLRPARQNHLFTDTADPSIVGCVRCGLLFRDAFYAHDGRLKRKFSIIDGTSEYRVMRADAACKPKERP